MVSSLSMAYPEPWKEEPWNEFFSPEEAGRFVREALARHGFQGFLALSKDRKVMGFTWGYPMTSKELSAYAGWAEIPKIPEKIFYLAELGVLCKYRKEGVGLTLSEKLLKKATRPVVLRTDRCAQPAIKLYEQHLGFVPLLSSSGEQMIDPSHQSRLYWWLE